MEPADYQKIVKKFNQEMPDYCPITYAMKILGSKWKLPIIFKLMLQDGQHYNHLRRMLGDGITNFMLTKSLRELETDGLISRHDDHQMPPSVTYHLTPLGKKLIKTMEQLFNFGQELHQDKETKKKA